MALMKRSLLCCCLLLALAACAPAQGQAISNPVAVPNQAATATALPAASATPLPAASPTAIAEVPQINPLTGLPAEAQLLNRRPILVKVENLPRNNRPQWGLSFADHVYEYYTEEGTTRFAAVYYGQNAEKVAPIRSARFFDIQLIQMYKAVFIFGNAYEDLLNELFSRSFADRLLVEQPGSCPYLCRTEVNYENILMANTATLGEYLQQLGIDNSLQDLHGLAFQDDLPAGGQEVSQIFVRFSGAIYNRWDYDAASGRYLRYSDAENDLDWDNEVYEQLTDRLTGQPIAVDNLVILLAEYVPLVKTEESEVNDVNLTGGGLAYVARQGRLYPVRWQHTTAADMITLVDEDGAPFPLKPGQTWFEVMGKGTRSKQEDSGAWRFVFWMP